MTEKQIFNLLVSKGLTECGAAALMGHFQAESGMNPKNLENQYEKKLGYTDASYTAAVDSGTYTNFVRDYAGYGLVQWTYWSRKQNLLNFARSMGRSIGDMEMQVLFCVQELNGYKTVWQAVTTGTSIRNISDIILKDYENPANQSESVKKLRAGYGQEIYNRCAGKKGEATMTEAQARQKIVDIAAGWVGRNMKDGTHKPIIDIYNSHKPLARGYAVKYTDTYCAVTVSAAAIEAGYTDIIPAECGCPQMVELFKKLDRWQENDTYAPQVGDILFYDWQDTGVGDNVGVPDHVGIVASVSGLSIKVLEGNLNGAVGYRTLCVNGKYIRGYGVPDYASKAGQGSTSGPAAGDTYTPYAVYQNGSTAEPVYSNTGATGAYIGSLDPYEKCECLGIVDGMAHVLYKVNGTNHKKAGFVKWLGGVKK